MGGKVIWEIKRHARNLCSTLPISFTYIFFCLVLMHHN